MTRLKKSKNAHKTEREKLDESREEVLSKGKKFKYPLQFAKHRMILITIAIITLSLFGTLFLGYRALYKTQSTSDVAYRITKVLPLPVAKIDGESVRYSDYLMIYRASITPVERQSTVSSTTDVTGMQNYYKREALNEAEDNAYVEKLARELNLTVSDDEITSAFETQRSAGGINQSNESFLKVLSDNLGVTESEYRHLLHFSLLRMKVEAAIDETARSLASEVETALSENDHDLEKVASLFPETVIYESTNGMVSTLNVDGGRAAKAYATAEGQVAGPFTAENGSGYYFVKCLKKGENEVAYDSLFIEFTELDSRLSDLRKNGQFSEYIDLPASESNDPDDNTGANNNFEQ